MNYIVKVRKEALEVITQESEVVFLGVDSSGYYLSIATNLEELNNLLLSKELTVLLATTKDGLFYDWNLAKESSNEGLVEDCMLKVLDSDFVSEQIFYSILGESDKTTFNLYVKEVNEKIGKLKEVLKGTLRERVLTFESTKNFSSEKIKVLEVKAINGLSLIIHDSFILVKTKYGYVIVHGSFRNIDESSIRRLLTKILGVKDVLTDKILEVV